VIEKLFTSKNRVSILAFLMFKKNESYLRQIAKETKISVSAVKREVDSLGDLGILNVSKGEVSLNEECTFIEDLKNILIKSDYLYLPIQKYLDNKNIKFALIFGSFANGMVKSESDVDLFVIGDLSLSEIYKSLKKAEGEIDRVVNPVVWTEKTFLSKKDSALVKDILKKKFIMIRGDENEFRKIAK